MKKNTFTTIEFSDTHVVLLRTLISRGAPVLTHAEIVRLGGARDEDLARALTALVGDKPVDNLKVLIPGRYVIFKQITLPSHTGEEIQRMIGLQIGHLGPFSVGEIVHSHAVLEKSPSGYAKVLLAIIQKENVERYLKALHKAKLASQKLVLGSQGIVQWLRYQKKHARPADHGGLMILDLDADNTEISFCRNDKLFFSRNIRFGARDLEGDHVNLFMEQIGLTLGAYRKEEMGPAIEKILVVANCPAREVLAEKLKEYYRIPVEVVSSLDHVQQDKGFAMPEAVTREGISLTRGLGFCLNPGGEPVMNLMPREVLDTHVSKANRLVLVKFLLALGLAGLLTAVTVTMRLHFGREYLKTIEQRINETEARVGQAKQQVERLRSLDQIQGGRILFNDVLRELYRLTPPDISFHSLNLDGKGNFEIQGYAQTGAAVNQFQNKLVASRLFSNVTLLYATKRVRFREEYTEFKIVCQLDVEDGAYDR